MLNDKEFAAIVNRTKPVVLSAVREHLPARFAHAIDDISQETYFRAYRSLAGGSFRKDSSVETWLYVIARNETLRAVSKLIREEEKIQKISASVSDNADGSEPLFSTGFIAGLVSRLSVPHRKVFELLIAGKKEREISKELGIPQGTVKSRISRGKVELRKLREENDENKN